MSVEELNVFSKTACLESETLLCTHVLNTKFTVTQYFTYSTLKTTLDFIKDTKSEQRTFSRIVDSTSCT